MMTIKVEQLPCAHELFLQKLDAYRAERVAHRTTINKPAPFPEFEVLRTICEHEERGGSWEIVLPPPPPEPTERELMLKEASALMAAKAERDRVKLEDALLCEVAKLPDASPKLKQYAAKIVVAAPAVKN